MPGRAVLWRVAPGPGRSLTVAAVMPAAGPVRELEETQLRVPPPTPAGNPRCTLQVSRTADAVVIPIAVMA
ncbi:hypothetical protein ACIBAG_35900 [Streptomyces sp. NPDC051243]|uniref:hypothetical protein n=1 Tax=Streptomyces sp. NPDC051243 TaxID=3365646 RepID=UPI0037A4BF0B